MPLQLTVTSPAMREYAQQGLRQQLNAVAAASGGGQRPSLGDYITVTGGQGRTPATGGA
jgi:hypothetical protein